MSPSRRVCRTSAINLQWPHTYDPPQAKKKQVSYKESDSEGEEDDEVIFRPSRKNGRASKRQKTVVESDEEEFKEPADDAGYSDDGMLCLGANDYPVL
jgi:DNA mismatch repair protein MSH6